MEGKALAKVLVEALWRQREAVDALPMEDFRFAQGRISALKEVVSLLEGGVDDERRDEE